MTSKCASNAVKFLGLSFVLVTLMAVAALADQPSNISSSQVFSGTTSATPGSAMSTQNATNNLNMFFIGNGNQGAGGSTAGGGKNDRGGGLYTDELQATHKGTRWFSDPNTPPQDRAGGQIQINQEQQVVSPWQYLGTQNDSAPRNDLPQMMPTGLQGMVKKAAASLGYATPGGVVTPLGARQPTNWDSLEISMVSAMAQSGMETDPQNTVGPARAELQAQATQAGNAAGQLEQNQAASALGYVSSYMDNFTVNSANKWNALRDRIFVPIAILLLLPGAILAQARAIVAAGSPVFGYVNPFEGILRSIIAIFMIPGTALVVNYSIDLSNSLTYAVNSEYTRIFGSNMYLDALAAQIRAFPVRDPDTNENIISRPQAPTTPWFNPNGTFSAFEGLINNREMNAQTGTDIAPADRADEALSSASIAAREVMFGSNAMLATTWNVLCGFQMAYMYYLWFVGPIVAALWVWPMGQLRSALPNWIQGVVTLAFWSLLWNTTVLLMACFKGVDETGTVMITALNLLATGCVKYAFDFAGLVSSAGQQASSMGMNMAQNAAQAGGQGSSGASGGGRQSRGSTASTVGSARGGSMATGSAGAAALGIAGGLSAVGAGSMAAATVGQSGVPASGSLAAFGSGTSGGAGSPFISAGSGLPGLPFVAPTDAELPPSMIAAGASSAFSANATDMLTSGQLASLTHDQIAALPGGAEFLAATSAGFTQLAYSDDGGLMLVNPQTGESLPINSSIAQALGLGGSSDCSTAEIAHALGLAAPGAAVDSVAINAAAGGSAGRLAAAPGVVGVSAAASSVLGGSSVAAAGTQSLSGTAETLNRFDPELLSNSFEKPVVSSNVVSPMEFGIPAVKDDGFAAIAPLKIDELSKEESIAPIAPITDYMSLSNDAAPIGSIASLTGGSAPVSEVGLTGFAGSSPELLKEGRMMEGAQGLPQALPLTAGQFSTEPTTVSQASQPVGNQLGAMLTQDFLKDTNSAAGTTQGLPSSPTAAGHQEPVIASAPSHQENVSSVLREPGKAALAYSYETTGQAGSPPTLAGMPEGRPTTANWSEAPQNTSAPGPIAAARPENAINNFVQENRQTAPAYSYETGSPSGPMGSPAQPENPGNHVLHEPKANWQDASQPALASESGTRSVLNAPQTAMQDGTNNYLSRESGNTPSSNLYHTSMAAIASESSARCGEAGSPAQQANANSYVVREPASNMYAYESNGTPNSMRQESNYNVAAGNTTYGAPAERSLASAAAGSFKTDVYDTAGGTSNSYSIANQQGNTNAGSQLYNYTEQGNTTANNPVYSRTEQGNSNAISQLYNYSEQGNANASNPAYSRTEQANANGAGQVYNYSEQRNNANSQLYNFTEQGNTNANSQVYSRTEQGNTSSSSQLNNYNEQGNTSANSQVYNRTEQGNTNGAGQVYNYSEQRNNANSQLYNFNEQGNTSSSSQLNNYNEQGNTNSNNQVYNRSEQANGDAVTQLYNRCEQDNTNATSHVYNGNEQNNVNATSQSYSRNEQSNPNTQSYYSESTYNTNEYAAVRNNGLRLQDVITDDSSTVQNTTTSSPVQSNTPVARIPQRSSEAAASQAEVKPTKSSLLKPATDHLNSSPLNISAPAIDLGRTTASMNMGAKQGGYRNVDPNELKTLLEETWAQYQNNTSSQEPNAQEPEVRPLLNKLSQALGRANTIRQEMPPESESATPDKGVQIQKLINKMRQST